GGADALPPRAPEPRRRGSDSYRLARLERCARADTRQRIHGGGPRPPRLAGRRLDPRTAQMKKPPMKKLSHFDAAGSPRMVDVSAKPETRRTARAHAFVRIRPSVMQKLPENPKGNPLEIARIA